MEEHGADETARVHVAPALGEDDFAAMAHKIWKEAGVKPAAIPTPESYTGAFVKKMLAARP